MELPEHRTNRDKTQLVSDPAVPDETETVYDGGRRAWMTVAGGLLVAIVTFGYTNSFGVYQDVYTRSHAASPSSISWIGSTQLFCLLGMGLPAGKLLDMGYFRHTVLVGSVVLVFSMFMVSIAHPDKFYQIYLAQGLGMGIGAGLLYVPAIAVQAHYWRDRRALAMGMAVSGTSIGGVIFPIMLNNLLKNGTTFGWSVRYSTFVILGLLILANVLLADKPAVRAQNRPKSNIREILTDVPYLLCILGVFFVDWGVPFPYFYLQLFSIERGIDPNIAFYSLAIMNASSLPGRLIPNLLADRFGPYNVFIPCTIACAVLIFSMFAIKTAVGMIIFAAFYGFFSGGFLSLFGPCIAILSKDPSEIGVRFGFAYFLTGFGALTGPPIGGALLGKNSNWARPILFSGIATLIGVFFVLMTRQLAVKRRGSMFV